jgi:hypothetical protein
MFGTMLGLHLIPFFGSPVYAGLLLAASVAYMWFAKEVLRHPVDDTLVLVLLAGSLALRATFLAAVPVGSDDVYRYIWDGKVQAAGLNPYLYAPNAPALTFLASDLLPAAVNHPELKSVYFPLSQWIFYLSYAAGGEHVWAFKAFLLVAETLTIVAVWRLAPALHVPRSSTLLYALCPLPIFQFAYDAHLDGLGIPLLAFALLYHLRRQRMFSLLLLGASLAVKPVGLVLLPFLVMREKSAASRILTALLPFVPFVIQFVPYLSSANPFEGLATFSRHWTFNGIAFEALDAVLADNLVARLVCAALLVAALLILLRSRVEEMAQMYYAVLFLLLLSPVVHPWYVCWLVLFMPFLPRWSGIVYAATASLTVITVIQYRSTGVWTQHPLALIGEYGPVLGLLGWELWKERSLHR